MVDRTAVFGTRPGSCSFSGLARYVPRILESGHPARRYGKCIGRGWELDGISSLYSRYLHSLVHGDSLLIHYWVAFIHPNSYQGGVENRRRGIARDLFKESTARLSAGIRAYCEEKYQQEGSSQSFSIHHG
jgi:hypothetical protein